jgi:hypothetical protein
MPEQRGYSPKHEDAKKETKEVRESRALERYVKSLESAGRKLLFLLGPAMAVGSSAFAAENGPSVEAHEGQEIHCDIAYMDAQGEQVGAAVIKIPSLESLPQADTTLETSINKTGDCTGDRIVGLLTETKIEKPETTPEDPSLLDKLKSTAKKVSDQTYSGDIKGMGSAVGWTFNIDTSKATGAWAGYDVKLTTALVVEKSYGTEQIMKGKLPETPGVFLQLKVKPRS